MSNGNFRICPDTGFKVDLPGEKLIKINAVTAVVFLLIGGLHFTNPQASICLAKPQCIFPC